MTSTETVGLAPYLNVGKLSDGRTLQANGRIVKVLSAYYPQPDLTEAEALSLIALRQLTWLPKTGRWYNASGLRIPFGSTTEAWINSWWRDKNLVRMNGQLRGEFGCTGWRAYRRLLHRGLTPLEHFHERWSRCKGVNAYTDYVVAAADADYVVGAMVTPSGPIVDQWLDHAERSLAALNACREREYGYGQTVRVVDLDALTGECP